jgi:hypothetical protein
VEGGVVVDVVVGEVGEGLEGGEAESLACRCRDPMSIRIAACDGKDIAPFLEAS